ncbi:hypothetical protein F4779DRAFT_613931 [Xylariaceae sp. FL0662B]|nr:hypothetical protein F4779DRAFT_613931 [Xylariaceae sp. FL0662B]
MAEDLRTKLGKSQIKSQNQGDPHVPWKPEVWNAAIAAFHAGVREPEPRFPVVISSDGPVDSPEKLQRLADLPSIPAVLESQTIDRLTESTKDDVRISDVTWEELKILRERTEWERILVWFPDERTKKRVMRNAWVIKSVKGGNIVPSDIDEK